MSCKQQVFRIALLLVATFSPWAAHAGICAFDAGQNVPITSIVNFTGSITVGRDRAIGDEIYRGTFHGSPVLMDISCGSGNNDRARKFVTEPVESGYSHKDWGPVYKTGVPGVGLVIWVGGADGGNVPFGAKTDTPPGSTFRLNAQRWFDFSLIKIGDVLPGTVRGVDIPGFDYRIGDNQLLIQAARFSGALNIVAQTCETPNITKSLGDFTLDVLQGVGTTTPTVDVDVALNQCPAFYGSYRNDVNREPSTPQDLFRRNAINFKIDPTGDVLDFDNGVIALSTGGATGMGVQILDGNGNPMKFGQMLPSNLVLNMTSSGSYTLKLGARYYQVNPTTTPGPANASVTMTLEYL